MATHFINDNNTSTSTIGPVLTTAAGDTTFVFQGITALTDADAASVTISLVGASNILTVNGTVQNTQTTAVSNASNPPNTSNTNRIFVGITGQIIGPITGGVAALSLSGTGNTLENYGLIEGVSFGAGGSIFNAGKIRGKGIDAITVANTTASPAITNHGEIISDFIGIRFTGNIASTVRNYGKITGEGGTAIVFGDGNDLLDSRAGTVNGVVKGGAGNDTLQTGAGDDTLDGGAGVDTLSGGAGLDYASYESSANGITASLANRFLNTGDAFGDVYLSIEGLIGSNLADRLSGNSGANALIGGLGEDTLTGGDGSDTLEGGEGADTLTGGAGHDLLKGGAGADSMSGDAGDDELDGGDATDTLTGGDGDDILVGGDGADSMVGGAGDDVLDGRDGDAAGDTMIGGAGNDSYYIDELSDVVVEAARAGNDTLHVTNTVLDNDLTYSLQTTSTIENLSVADILDAANVKLNGNQVGNVLTGNAGANILDGKAGADTMIGGLGNDTYKVDNLKDVVIEDSTAGTDIVEASVSYALSLNVDNLTLSGKAAIGIGNDDPNVITGNGAANKLDGRAGSDTLIGDLGNDTLVGGSGNDALSGGLGNDALSGDLGNDKLTGGLGNDKLTGGLGADRFVFDSAFEPTNVDTIVDFKSADGDKIALAKAIFTALPDTLTAGNLVTGPQALDADDFIIHDKTNGILYYDADGNGTGAAVKFATLTKGLDLAFGSFEVIV